MADQNERELTLLGPGKACHRVQVGDHVLDVLDERALTLGLAVAEMVWPVDNRPLADERAWGVIFANNLGASPSTAFRNIRLMKTLAKGAVAGLIGTGLMTAAQRAEMRLTGRPPSMVPGRVASKLLRLEPEGDEALARVSLRMHWAHGMTQGTVRALIGRLGFRGPAAAATHFALMWGGDALLYRTLGISPWPWQWSLEELAPDVLHKGLYVVATSAAYDSLA